MASKEFKMIKYFKFIFWVALFLVLVSYGKAHAESWAMDNKAGGKIVITDRQCKYFTYLSESYTYTSEGNVYKSCWSVVEGSIHVVYFDGSKKVYPIKYFSPQAEI